MSGDPKKIKRIKTIPILINQYVGFQKDIIRLPDGIQSEYFLTNRGSHASFILPIDPRGRLLLLHEYRYPIGKYIIGPVAGAVQKGETPLQAAKRELKEEAGYNGRTWKRLGRFYASPAKSDTVFYVYTVRQLTLSAADPDPYEYITPRWYTQTQVRALIRRGAIQDGYLLAVLLLYFQKKAENRAP